MLLQKRLNYLNFNIQLCLYHLLWMSQYEFVVYFPTRNRRTPLACYQPFLWQDSVVSICNKKRHFTHVYFIFLLTVEFLWACWACYVPIFVFLETKKKRIIMLEYHNFWYFNILVSDTANRVSYTNQTPQKKRRLTYQCIPGRKGQTQLVFK